MIPSQEEDIKLVKDEEINELKELLKKKKAEKELIESKYMPLVAFICDVIKEENIDPKVLFKLVLSSLEERNENVLISIEF